MPTLTLLRRHRPACDAQHPVGSLSTEAEERRRNWKRCACKIYAHGTLSGVFHRLATKARDWERAKEVVAPYLEAGRWDIRPPELAPVPPPSPTPEGPPPREHQAGVPIGDAVKKFLKRHETNQSADNTVKKYGEVMGQWERFSREIGLGYIEQWTRPYVRDLLDRWGEQGNGQLTVQKKLSVLKAFFEPYFEDHVLAENPARIKTQHRNRAFRMREGTNSKQVNPYTDEELERMLEGCGNLGRTKMREWPREGHKGRKLVAITEFRQYHRKWTGEDLAEFIQISYFTGLRISDVATFDIARLNEKGEVNVRATKNGEWVSVWIPEWLRATIGARALRIGPLIFGKHATTDINVITDVWRRKLNVLWSQTGPWKHKPTPHRFRHTFVRILLERHVPVSVIAELTGDTEQMIRKHYSAWNPERQESHSRILAQAFAGVPRFHKG